MSAPTDNRMQALDWANALGFMVYAGSATITPIALLVLARELHFTLAFAGSLEIARSLLIVAALLLSGFLAGRFGKARSLAVASGLLAVGLLAYAIAPHVGLVILALAVAGCGGGVIEGLINPLVQDQHPHNSARYLNIVNGFWSVGVVLTMVLGGEALTQGVSWRLLIGVLASLALLAALGYGLNAAKERSHQRLNTRVVWAQGVAVIRHRHFWLFWLMMVLAGGAEGALTFWGASFIQLGFDASARMGGLTVALFGIGMIGGRFLAGLLIAQHRLHNAMLWSALIALLASLALPWIPQMAVVMVLFSVAGFGLACLWPSLQSFAAERMAVDSTMLFILLSCGGIPGYAAAAWLMGLGIAYWGFTAGFMGVAGGMLLLIILLLAVRQLPREQPSNPSP